jgi:ribose 5-phosphate isomerase RpiB
MDTNKCKTSLSGWQLNNKKAEKLALTWLATEFSGEERHKRRIQKIKRLE